MFLIDNVERSLHELEGQISGALYALDSLVGLVNHQLDDELQKLAELNDREFAQQHADITECFCDMVYLLSKVEQNLPATVDYLRVNGLIEFPVIGASQVEAVVEYVFDHLKAMEMLYRARLAEECDENLMVVAVTVQEYSRLEKMTQAELIVFWHEQKQAFAFKVSEAAEKETTTVSSDPLLRGRWLKHRRLWFTGFMVESCFKDRRMIKRMEALCKIEISNARNRLRTEGVVPAQLSTPGSQEADRSLYDRSARLYNLAKRPEWGRPHLEAKDLVRQKLGYTDNRDTPKKSQSFRLPENQNVVNLCRYLQQHPPKPRRFLESVRKFCDENKIPVENAESLKRQALRYSNLWKHDD